jgi:UrcA family protein
LHSPLVQTPHAYGEQSAVLIALDAEFDGAAADLAVFYIRRLLGRQVDAGFQPFTAIGTLDRYELLGQQAPGRPGAGLIDGLEAIELIDAARIQAADPAPERFELDGFSAFHRAILRDEPFKRFCAGLHLSTRRRNAIAIPARPVTAGVIMKSTIAKRCALICVATVAAGLAVNQASAAPSDEAAKSVVVRFSDLDLAQPQDARTLYARIQRAAHEACGDAESADLARFARYHNCIQQAVTNAVAQVNARQVTEIHEAQSLRQSRS